MSLLRGLRLLALCLWLWWVQVHLMGCLCFLRLRRALPVPGGVSLFYSGESPLDTFCLGGIPHNQFCTKHRDFCAIKSHQERKCAVEPNTFFIKQSRASQGASLEPNLPAEYLAPQWRADPVAFGNQTNIFDIWKAYFAHVIAHHLTRAQADLHQSVVTGWRRKTSHEALIPPEFSLWNGCSDHSGRHSKAKQ